MDYDDNISMRDNLVLFLQEKEIPEPESQADLILNNSKAKERASRVLDGDIRSNKTTFTKEFLHFVDMHKIQIGKAESPWDTCMNSLLTMTNEQVDVIGRKRAHSSGSERAAKSLNVEGISVEVSPPIPELMNDHAFWLQFENRDFHIGNIHDILVIRKQNSGICYLHGAVTLEHYLTAISSKGRERSMIDIGIYEARNLSGNELMRFLLETKGGDSRQVLLSICGLYNNQLREITLPNPTLHEELFKQNCEQIYNQIMIKPYLVSGFCVYPDFKQRGKVFYQIGDLQVVPADTKVSTHSMLLIGVRKDSAQYIFLLQNWWALKYFVEVTAEYFQFCGGRLIYVEAEFERRLDLITYVSSYAETSLDADGDECCDECV